MSEARHPSAAAPPCPHRAVLHFLGLRAALLAGILAWIHAPVAPSHDQTSWLGLEPPRPAEPAPNPNDFQLELTAVLDGRPLARQATEAAEAAEAASRRCRRLTRDLRLLRLAHPSLDPTLHRHEALAHRKSGAVAAAAARAFGSALVARSGESSGLPAWSRWANNEAQVELNRALHGEIEVRLLLMEARALLEAR